MPTTSPICRAGTGLAVSTYKSSSVATTSSTRVSSDVLKRITFGSRFVPRGTRIDMFSVASGKPPLPYSRRTNVLWKSSEIGRDKILPPRSVLHCIAQSETALPNQKRVHARRYLSLTGAASQSPADHGLRFMTPAKFNQVLNRKRFYGTRHPSVLSKLVLHRHEQNSYR